MAVMAVMTTVMMVIVKTLMVKTVMVKTVVVKTVVMMLTMVKHEPIAYISSNSCFFLLKSASSISA